MLRAARRPGPGGTIARRDETQRLRSCLYKKGCIALSRWIWSDVVKLERNLKRRGTPAPAAVGLTRAAAQHRLGTFEGLGPDAYLDV